MSFFSQAKALVEEKVEQFVSSNPSFHESFQQAFDSLAFGDSREAAFKEAARGVNKMFDSLQDSLTEFGITVRKPTEAELRGFFDAAEKKEDGSMTQEEFMAFYVRVLKFTAVECVSGVSEKYGAGMLAGIVGVFVAKRVINAIPVVGTFSSPFLALLPALLVGPVVGAAAVYSYNQKDWLAVQKRFFPKKTE